MKKHITLLFAAFIALATFAQSGQKVKTVMLKTGVAFEYNKENQDSARVLYTPQGDSLAIKIYLQNAAVSDFLYSQIDYVEYWKSDNANKNTAADLAKNPEGWRLEFPRFYQGPNVTFEVTHSTKQYGITYSLEWDGTLRANRWVCYQMHQGNMANNVRRTNNWGDDPKVPAKYRTTQSDYSGSNYSRGHLCPSSDRLCSEEQNTQTFYYTNMQPQKQDHNGGVWNNLEQKLRDSWSPRSGSGDTLYVVKAATIDEGNIKEYTKSGLIVPKYFYMALLYYYKSTNTYTAVGVWSPHAGGSTTEYITIDELEKRTGIDFFCNLPDDIENAVESKIDRGHWN